MSDTLPQQPIIRGHGLGLVPDAPDPRDFKFSSTLAAAPATERTFAPAASLHGRKKAIRLPGIYEQGERGSCVGQSLSRNLVGALSRERKRLFKPSRLHIYYNARAEHGTVNEDSGCSIRVAIKTLAGQGVCVESYYPHDISRYQEPPSKRAVSNAAIHRIGTYAALEVGSLDDIRAAITDGFAVTCGIPIYTSFYNDPAGVIPFPDFRERLYGYHAITVEGYDDQTERLMFANSWGTGWGTSGYGWLPYGFVTGRLLFDAWVISTARVSV